MTQETHAFAPILVTGLFWLVVDTKTPLKNMKFSWDDDILN